MENKFMDSEAGFMKIIFKKKQVRKSINVNILRKFL